MLAHADLVIAQAREATADQARIAELEQMVGRLTVELEAANSDLRLTTAGRATVAIALAAFSSPG